MTKLAEAVPAASEDFDEAMTGTIILNESSERIHKQVRMIL
ncbi:hypothetical protein [Tuberibacillus sp. Marseille-P3662]|nr:hypothetical protein [Tuberibacillus sp. Marseille-P3662]